MIIESTLTREEFVRHSLTRHFSRPSFYFYAFVFAALTTYTFITPGARQTLYLAAVLPVLAYSLGGVIAALRRSRDKNMPLYLPIRYEFGPEGVEVSSRLGRTVVNWADIRNWRKVVGVYELAIGNGQLLLISQQAVAPRQVAPFEELLDQRIYPKPKQGRTNE
jgi:hypothetical protein